MQGERVRENWKLSRHLTVQFSLPPSLSTLWNPVWIDFWLTKPRRYEGATNCDTVRGELSTMQVMDGLTETKKALLANQTVDQRKSSRSKCQTGPNFVLGKEDAYLARYITYPTRELFSRPWNIRLHDRFQSRKPPFTARFAFAKDVYELQTKFWVVPS